MTEKNPRIDHTHDRGERMTDETLRDHLAESHGWSFGMVAQRGFIEDGGYARAWHDNAHKTAHLDNPKGE